MTRHLDRLWCRSNRSNRLPEEEDTKTRRRHDWRPSLSETLANFDGLIRQHSSKLARQNASLLRGIGPDDLAQEMRLALCKAWDNYDNKKNDNFAAWFLTIWRRDFTSICRRFLTGSRKGHEGLTDDVPEIQDHHDTHDPVIIYSINRPHEKLLASYLIDGASLEEARQMLNLPVVWPNEIDPFRNIYRDLSGRIDPTKQDTEAHEETTVAPTSTIGRKVGKSFKSTLKSASNIGIQGLKGGETKTVRFLTEPDDFFLYNRYFDSDAQRYVPMIDGERVPNNYRVQSRYVAAVLDIESDKVIALDVPTSLAKKLDKKFDRYGTICDRDYEISRYGDGLDTEYELESDEKSKRNTSKYEMPDLGEILMDARNFALKGDESDDEDEKPKRGRKAAAASTKATSKRAAKDEDDEDEEDEDEVEEDDEDEEEGEGDEDDDVTYRTRSELAEIEGLSDLKEIATYWEIEPLPRGRQAIIDAIIEAQVEYGWEEPQEKKRGAKTAPATKGRKAKVEEDEEDEEDEEGDDDEEEIDVDDLPTMSLARLKSIAKSLGLNPIKYKTKDKLISAITEQAEG